MRTMLIVLFLLAPSVAASAAGSGNGFATEAAFRPVEVAKRKGFVVHAIPRSTDRGWSPRWMLLGQDYILTHTSLPDGKLKVLLRSGEYRVYSLPKGIDTITYHKTELLGVAVRGKRLVVLTRSFVGGGVLTTGASKTPKFSKPGYKLTLFDARDGEKLSTLFLNQVKIPAVAKLREIGPGPLKVERDRITLWSRVVRIDDRGRMILQAEAKKPAE